VVWLCVHRFVDVDEWSSQMRIHLVDGTYELFRNYFGAPAKKAPDGREVGATLGLLNSLLLLLTKSGATHVACAFDHVIESFRNDLFPGYKTGEGVAADLLAQFALAEQAVAALGIVVWPMVEFEADDALASATIRFRSAPGVEQVVICSPDKDVAQLVSGSQVVCWDRRRDIVYDEAAVLAKFGVQPASIPDWLALVGDSADGYPGLTGWGAKSASAVLARYKHLEAIPDDPTQWGLAAARALRLAESLRDHQEDVLLYRRLATLRHDVPLQERLTDLEWRGAQPGLKRLCGELGAEKLPARVPRWITDSEAAEQPLC
jgi:5'-3' exonuclease